LRLLCFGTLFLTLAVTYTLPSGSLIYFEINIAFLGFFLLPIIPVGYSFAIEMTFPVSEAMSNGIMMLFSQIIGSGVTVGATVLSGIDPLYCVDLFLVLISISCMTSLFIREDLRRVKFNTKSPTT